MVTFIAWLRKLRSGLGRRPRRGRTAPPHLEALEDRCLLSGSSFYSIDGTGNNLAHSEWGSVGVQLLRAAPAQYADGISALAGASRPSARAISVALVSDSTDGGLPNNRFLSDWIY